MESKDVFGVMASRRTIRKFLPKPVEMDLLLQIVQAGTLAPSSGNIQNWAFTLVTETEKIRELYHHSLDQEPFLSAQAAIIVTGDMDYAHTMYGMRGKRLYTVQNCAAAIQNILLAATANGLATAWIGAFDEDKVSDMFDIPSEKHRPQAIILVGYPGEEPEPKETKGLDCVIFFNSYGNKVMKPHLVFYDWATEWRLQAEKMKDRVKQIKERRQQPAENQDEGSSDQASEQTSELKPGTFSQMRDRMQDVVNSMKKEQYRK